MEILIIARCFVSILFTYPWLIKPQESRELGDCLELKKVCWERGNVMFLQGSKEKPLMALALAKCLYCIQRLWQILYEDSQKYSGPWQDKRHAQKVQQSKPTETPNNELLHNILVLFFFCSWGNMQVRVHVYCSVCVSLTCSFLLCSVWNPEWMAFRC